MKTIVFLGIIFAMSFAAQASEDSPLHWQAVTVEFGYGLTAEQMKGVEQQYIDMVAQGEGSVRIAIRDASVTELALNWNGSKFSVPAAEFEAVPAPQLETLKVLRGQFHGDIEGNAPYAVVQFLFGTPTFGEYPSAQFLFYSGRYRQLHITTRTSATTWETAVKNPGEDVFHGTTSKLVLPDVTQTASLPIKPRDNKPK